MELIEKSQKNNGSTFSIYTDFPLKFSKELKSVFYRINVFFEGGGNAKTINKVFFV